jgi:hypothetical protein
MDYKHLGSASITDIYFHISSYKNDFSLGGYLGYYFKYPEVIKVDASVGKFPLYWGPIGGVGYWDNGKGVGQQRGFAVRAGITGGVSWLLPDFPFDISLEANPVAEYHFAYTKDANDKVKKDKDNTGLNIPVMYFRVLFHAYLF